MIRKILRSIRQKPKPVREQYAFWIACTLTSVIALVWVVATMDHFGSTVESEASKQTESANPDTLSNFLEGAQKQMDDVQQEVLNVLPVAQTSGELSGTSTVVSATGTTGSTQTEAISTSSVTDQQEVRIATTSGSSTSGQAEE